MNEEDRFDLPQRTGSCRVHHWEMWDGECEYCIREEITRDKENTGESQ